ncbi:Wall-associated receptor kinase, C-terminal [Dillenia turbinata]|uniref:non-specific serine/threonine protein kinase n=1 Tax=Dillenia turbinata TaxID=194707 RepID=A0AAN8YZS5_9MAGN
MGYPFWGGEWQAFCVGHEGYQLKCHNNDYATIEMNELEFRVLHINQSNQTMRIARSDLWEDLCLEKYINTRNGISSVGFYVRESSADNEKPDFWLGNHSVEVPVFKPALDEFWDKNLTLQQALSQGFEVTYNVKHQNACLKCTESIGTCGSNVTMDSFQCFCGDGPTLSMCSGSAGAAAAAGILLTTFVFTVSCSRSRIFIRNMFLSKNMSKNDQTIEEFIKNFRMLMPKRYSHYDIKKMTNSFKVKLGQRGFGVVYKGKLPDGRLVAVKVLSKLKGKRDEFINEVASIGRTSHTSYARCCTLAVAKFVPYCYWNFSGA